MQRTETVKKDSRQEIALLNRRLQNYRTAYMQAALDWLHAWIDEESTVTEDRSGWTKIHADLEVERSLADQFEDIHLLMRPYSREPQELLQIWRTFFSRQIKPINDALNAYVKAWWVHTWRTYRV